MIFASQLLILKWQRFVRSLHAEKLTTRSLPDNSHGGVYLYDTRYNILKMGAL